MDYLLVAVSIVLLIAATAGVFALGVAIGWRTKSDLPPIPTREEIVSVVRPRSDEDEYEIAKKRGSDAA